MIDKHSTLDVMRQKTAIPNLDSARYSVGQLTDLGVMRYLAFQFVAIFIGYLEFSLLDFNNPDGITVPPTVGGLLLFIVIIISGTSILVTALNSRRLLRSTDWNVLGWGTIVTMFLVVIWYRGIWLVSPYVIEATSDHFIYLQQSRIISNLGSGWIPSTSDIVINSYSHTFLIAWLFNTIGQSTFLIIALQVMFVSWSTLCLLHLFAARHREVKPGPYADQTHKIALFFVMPFTIFTAGIITKDTFVLFGISVTLVAFYELNENQISLGTSTILAAGMLITIISRLGHSLALATSLVLPIFVFRKNLRQFVLTGLIIFSGASLAIWAVQTGLLAIYDQSVTGMLDSIVSPLQSGSLSYYAESPSFIYRLSHPIGEGRLASLLSLPLAGSATWFVPFPFFFSDYRAVLHTSSAISNIVSLTIFIASIQPLKATVFGLLKNRSNFIDSLMLSFILFMFLAIAVSSTPLARYRLPFDWAMLYFFFSQRNLGRSIGLGLYLALLMAALSHLLYYAIS